MFANLISFSQRPPVQSGKLSADRSQNNEPKIVDGFVAQSQSQEKSWTLKFPWFGSDSPQPQPEPEFPVSQPPVSNRDVDQTAFEQALIADLESYGREESGKLGRSDAFEQSETPSGTYPAVSGGGVRIQNHQDLSVLAGKLPTVGELEQEFQILAHDPAIPFEYISGGCASRAHLVCDKLQHDQINCGKIFAMVEEPAGPGQLTAHNQYMEAGWWYHVAAISFAQNPETATIEPYVLDAAIAPHLLQPKEWVKAMWDAKTNLKIDLMGAQQVGPIEIDGPAKSFEAGLGPARQELAIHAAELTDIKARVD